MTFTCPSFLKSLGWREVEHRHVFVSSSFGHLQGHVSQKKQESKEYQPLNADECMLRTTSSMLSVPPHRLIWGIHKLVLESLFQNLWISSRILLVISNWSCLKNSERLGYRKRMQLWNGLFVCVLKLLVERNKDIANTLILAENEWHCLVGVEYSNFLN